MENLKISFLLFTLFFAFGENKDICDFNDLECVTKAARKVYNTLLNTANDNLKIEPLVLNNFNGDIPGFKYVVNNAKLSPMKNCEPSVTYLNETNYAYTLQCTRLVLHANVVAKGQLGPIEVDGSDTVTITADNYFIAVKGQQSLVYNNEHQSKCFILSKANFVVDTVAHGDITFEAASRFGLTEAQVASATSYYRNNWKVLENKLRYPVITEFMKELLVEKIGHYVKDIPIERVIPKE